MTDLYEGQGYYKELLQKVLRSLNGLFVYTSEAPTTGKQNRISRENIGSERYF